MPRYEATFEATSPTDAIAVQRLAERLYDTLREERRAVGGDDGGSETLEEFAAIREAASRRSPGTLTVIYEPAEDTSDD